MNRCHSAFPRGEIEIEDYAVAVPDGHVLSSDTSAPKLPAPADRWDVFGRPG